MHVHPLWGLSTLLSGLTHTTDEHWGQLQGTSESCKLQQHTAAPSQEGVLISKWFCGAAGCAPIQLLGRANTAL